MVGAGGFASRALKMPHWGIFAPRDVTAGPGLFESTSAIPAKLRNTKRAIPLSKYRSVGGSWWIRTTEALSSRCTVCPHWPRGKAPIFICCPARTACVARCLIIIAKRHRKCKPFFSIFLRFFQKSLFQTLLRIKTCKRRAPRRGRAGRCKGVFGFGVSEKNRNLYVMASQPCWLSGLDRAIALAWSKAQWL